jgi:glycogen debranching enzyme
LNEKKYLSRIVISLFGLTPVQGTFTDAPSQLRFYGRTEMAGKAIGTVAI